MTFPLYLATTNPKMKNSFLSVCAICFMALSIVTTQAQTSVPNNMTYQGRLTDANGVALPDGNGYEVEIRLWNSATAGTLLWGTRYSGVPLKNGAFNLILGSGGTAISGAVTTDLKTAFNTVPVHFGITVTKNPAGEAIAGPAEILPRQQVFSSPFAFRADKAEDSARLGGQPAAYYSPTGSIIAFAGQTAPAGWLLCDGRTLTAAAYPALSAVLGTSFGANGAGTFKLPDLRGRFPLGTNPAPLPDVPTIRPLAQAGGEESHVLTTSEMPAHSHEQKFSTELAQNYTGAYVAGGNYSSGPRVMRRDDFNSQSALPIAEAGGGAAHNNMPPFVVLNFIIKY